MGIIPFPQPEPEQPKPEPEKRRPTGIFPLSMLSEFLELFGDMTVGDVLAEFSKMPMKDVLSDLFGGINGEAGR